MHPIKDIESKTLGKSFLKRHEVQEVLRLSESSIKRLIRDGRLKPFKIGLAKHSPNLFPIEQILNLIKI